MNADHLAGVIHLCSLSFIVFELNSSENPTTQVLRQCFAQRLRQQYFNHVCADLLNTRAAFRLWHIFIDNFVQTY